jgi:putative aldouronate transport system permease protein
MASSDRFNTAPGRVFDVVNVVVLALVGIVAVLPFLYVLAGSFATESELTSRSFFVWPEVWTTASYEAIFATPAFARALMTTIAVTLVGTVLQLGLTVSMAYPLSRRDLPGRRLLMILVVFTMVFSAGMIPTFLVVKDLGLLDTYWALVLPLSKPVLATFALFYAVGIWNDFMSPLLYLSDTSMWTLQIYLRQVTASAELTAGDIALQETPPAQGVKFAVIAVATLPILLFYPFLQKHFAKGMLIGSVKG